MRTNIGLWVISCLIVVMIAGYYVAHGHVDDYRSDYTYKLHAVAPPFPPEMLQAIAGEFKGLVADYFLLEAASFVGSKQAFNAGPEDWSAVARLLEQSNRLDPYFRSTYMLAHGALPWRAKKYQETITILERSRAHLPWDWVPGFLIGFNYFFFLKDDLTASKKLMEASQIPGAPIHLATLASNLSTKAGQIDGAIAFLISVYERTEEEHAKETLRKRIIALQGIQILQEAVKRFQSRFGRMPANLEELVDRSILPSMPENPYNRPYSMNNGEIRY